MSKPVKTNSGRTVDINIKKVKKKHLVKSVENSKPKLLGGVYAKDVNIC